MEGCEHLLPFLDIKEVSINFGGLKALSNVNIKIKERDLLGIIGPNGAGKTTIFNTITGFLKPNHGSIVFKDTMITGLKPHEIAKMGIVRTFQIASIFKDLSVEENVSIGRYLNWKERWVDIIFKTANYRKEQKMLKSKVKEILELTGLLHKKNMESKYLSYGEQRRLEIAIALAVEPKLLILDEPAAGENAEECSELVALILKLNKELGMTIMIVEHNMKVVMGLCTNIVVLNFGEKIAEGKPVDIAKNKKVIDIYLGENKNANN